MKSIKDSKKSSVSNSLSPRVFRQRLLKWFDAFGRHDLPWQHPIDPYRVWLSEIMLQQTQVTTVIDYFQRFIQRFPTVSSLAKAHSDEVLQLWAGLGYYARARHLHRAAQIIATQFHGQFPNTVAQLVELPGIGESTAGAIVSISFNKPAAILDGNVKRVLTRVFAIEGHVDAPNVKQALWQIADTYSSPTHPRDYTQAIMDLGALVCTRANPNCNACPMQSGCLAFLHHRQADFPQKKPKKAKPKKMVTVLLLTNQQNHIWLEKRPSSGIWGGLYSLPEFSNNQAVKKYIEETYGLSQVALTAHPPLQHTFTHYQLTIKPVSFRVAVTHQSFKSMKQLNTLGLPAPIQRLLSAYTKG